MLYVYSLFKKIESIEITDKNLKRIIYIEDTIYV